MKRTLATVFLCLLLAPAAWAQFYVGLAAYQRGDYRPALREFRPLAENGSSSAQTYMGFMYEHGQGVSLDYAKAVLWYRKAAEQGNDIAQTNLGNMYLKGLGGILVTSTASDAGTSAFRGKAEIDARQMNKRE